MFCIQKDRTINYLKATLELKLGKNELKGGFFMFVGKVLLQ
jgi:hypothetical protein